MTSPLVDGYRALVIGASGAIGQAWLQLLEQDIRCGTAIGLSRTGEPALVLEDEDSLCAAAASVADQGPFHLVLDATGALVIAAL